MTVEKTDKLVALVKDEVTANLVAIELLKSDITDYVDVTPATVYRARYLSGDRSITTFEGYKVTVSCAHLRSLRTGYDTFKKIVREKYNLDFCID